MAVSELHSTAVHKNWLASDQWDPPHLIFESQVSQTTHWTVLQYDQSREARESPHACGQTASTKACFEGIHISRLIEMVNEQRII